MTDSGPHGGGRGGGQPVGGEREVPLFSVVHGRPSVEEVAALVAVISAVSDGGRDAPPAARPSVWADPARRMRPTLSPGPDAWRLSARG
ncbi:MAG: hypothetical protein JWP61_95 [Friedmanniella sp.]|nr:hypothetical protein [Friedmanniella sp.]